MPVNVSDSGMLQRRLQALEVRIRGALLTVGERTKQRAIMLQNQEAPETIATGQTIRSQTVAPVRRDADSKGIYFYTRVGPRTPYAYYGIERGRRPGRFPPLYKIMEWVKEKPGGSGYSSEQLFLISRSIQVKIGLAGTKAHNIMRRASYAERDANSKILRSVVMDTLRGR